MDESLPKDRTVGGDGNACTLVPLVSELHADVFKVFTFEDGTIWPDLPCTLQSMNPPVWVAPNWFLYALFPLVRSLHSRIKCEEEKPAMRLVRAATRRALKDPAFAEALWSVWLASPELLPRGSTQYEATLASPHYRALRHFIRKNV